MIGIVLCCHGKMGMGILDAAKMIAGDCDKVKVVSVEPGEGSEQILGYLKKAINDVETGDGVLLLTDLFGGTPTNIGCTLLKELKLEILTGLSLPILLKALSARTNDMSLFEIAKISQEYGRRHMSIAGELLDGKKS